MLLTGTEMHLVTFCFAVIETVMFLFQVVFYLSRPEDKARLWYLMLLSLLITYNVTSGLFPDKNYHIPIVIQNIICYGSGFCMASYFPFYFYRAFGLTQLRFHARYGIFLFLLVPYIVCFVIVYAINKNLEWARQYGLIIPFLYSISLIVAITKAIMVKYRQTTHANEKNELIAVYLAVVPWSSLAAVVYFDAPQPVEASITNFGFLVVTIMYVRRTIRQYRSEYSELQELNTMLAIKVQERTRKLEALYTQKMELQKAAIMDTAFNTLKIIGNNEPLLQTLSQRLAHTAKLYELTSREIEVVKLIAEGNSNNTIAKKLYISKRTVTTHIDNVFKKVEVTNRVELIKKLDLTLPL
jgi:DNA-binding CsgD family transcriptional regulator